MFEVGDRKIRILMVDSDTENLETGRIILESEGYDIYIAHNGETALELICSINFDMVLIGISLPDMDGFEALNILKNNEHSKDIPVIFLTDRLDVETVVKGFMSGAVDYIRKPFVEVELKARVKNHVKMKKISEELAQKTTDLREAYSLIEFINTTDPLTNLCNRREIINRLEAEKVRFERYSRPFSLIAADIDNFERINETYGRRFGDYVITCVADILNGGSRKQDSIARLEGGQFLILLPETGRVGAINYAEKNRIRIEEHEFIKEDSRARITMTFGISAYDGKQEIEELVERAEKALYDGKKKAKNCVYANQ
ncbi:MAG: diguanylate cyclase [Clostridiales bacterium]|jgi:diguanylate cyclase (GGDEF)-like protein|nr:diguanylate cyclase [Clostridiales bacterium]